MNRQVKKRHHVVWKHYLGPWSTGQKVWLRREGEIVRTSLDNVAVRRLFYALRDMTAADLRLAEGLIDQIAPDLRFLAKGWLRLYYNLPRLNRMYREAGLPASAVGRELEALVANFEEDLHAEIEGQSISVLASLRDSDGSLIEDPGKFAQFCLFVSAQTLRTPADHTLVQERMADFGTEGDIEAIWGLLRTAFTGVSTYWLGCRMKTTAIVYLRVTGDAELIVGDQPILNLAAFPAIPGIPPKDLLMYFPISPKLGAVVNFESKQQGVTHLDVGDDVVESLNHRMDVSSHGQVFAATKATLEALSGN